MFNALFILLCIVAVVSTIKPRRRPVGPPAALQRRSMADRPPPVRHRSQPLLPALALMFGRTIAEIKATYRATIEAYRTGRTMSTTRTPPPRTVDVEPIVEPEPEIFQPAENAENFAGVPAKDIVAMVLAQQEGRKKTESLISCSEYRSRRHAAYAAAWEEVKTALAEPLTPAHEEEPQPHV